MFNEESYEEPTCDKCGHTFKENGEKIIIVHIGMYRCDVCVKCAKVIKEFATKKDQVDETVHLAPSV